MEIISKRIRKLRQGANLTQSQVAKLIGVAQNSLSRYEQDTADLPSETLLWYADYFDVSLDYLFGRTDKPQGKLCEYKPEIIKQIASQNEKLNEFVEMCFDPKSSMNDRLKNALLQVLSEEKKYR